MPLFSIYISLPFFSAIPAEKRKTLFVFFLTAWFIFGSVLPFVNTLFGLGLNIPALVNIGNGYLFYVFAGYLLNCYPVEKGKLRSFIYVLAVLGVLFQVVGTHVLSFQNGRLTETFKGYLTPFGILQSIGMFIFIKQLGEAISNPYIWRFLNWFSRYTFSVYLMHYFVITLLQAWFPGHITSIWWRVLVPLPVIAICILCTWCLRKIPGLREIVP